MCLLSVVVERGLRRDDGELVRACLEEVGRFGDDARLDGGVVIASRVARERDGLRGYSSGVVVSSTTMLAVVGEVVKVRRDGQGRRLSGAGAGEVELE